MFLKYMVSIARKNLFQDKARLITTLIALAFSSFLILISMGMAIGTLNDMVVIIDQLESDIWVLNQGNEHLMSPTPALLDESYREQIEKVEGVKECKSLIYSNGMIDHKGEQTAIIVIGCNLSADFATPWEMEEGTINALRQNNSVIVDKSLFIKYDKIPLDTNLSINGYSQEVVGVSKGAKSFIYPFVFTSYTNALRICMEGQNTTNYFLVTIENQEDLTQVANTISKIEGIDAYPSQEVRKGVIHFMLAESGMGLGTVFMAVVGAFVSIIIIAIVIYTATMERIPEFGTLKAIGASKKTFILILLEQVWWVVTLGYASGVALSFIIFTSIKQISLMPIETPALFVLGTYLILLVLSFLSSLISIRKVNKVDPSIVFRS